MSFSVSRCLRGLFSGEKSGLVAHQHDEISLSIARSRDGRWFWCNRQPESESRRGELVSDLEVAIAMNVPLGADRVYDCGFVGDHLMVFHRYSAKVGDMLRPPSWLVGDKWIPIPGLPAAEARPSVLLHSIDDPVTGIVQLQDGNDVVVWDGDGYELSGERLEKTFPMQARDRELTWTYAAAGPSGFFYLSNRCLYEIHRHGKPKPHAENWTNIMYVFRGPSGSILLQEGDNRHGDVAKLYFPADGTFIHIEPELFDDRDYSTIYWNASADRFVVVADKFLAVSTDTVLSLPRYRASTGRRVKPSGDS